MLKKKIPWMILFLVLMVLSIWAVISHSGSYSLQLLKDTLKNAKVGWLIAACLGMLCNILFEGFALDVLVHAITHDQEGPKIRSNGLLYSAADIYFSAITPSASGGQPASAFFMSRDGITVAQSAVILVTNVFLYTISLVLLGVIGFFLCPSVFFRFDTLAKIFIILGGVFLVGLSVIFILVLKKEQWVKRLAIACITLGAKLRIIRKKEALLKRVDKMIAQYKACAGIVTNEKGEVLKAFAFNFLQRVSLLSTTVLVYLSFGGSLNYLPEVISVQALVLVGVYSLPIPGGMGVADYLLINGLTFIPDVASPANLELFSRGISFYCCLALSIVIVIAGYLRQNHRIKKLKAATETPSETTAPAEK
ncbi:MAG: flippase-like domain-containing protein [Clostridiales bacterium]|nr:flippase-like domain-containing protein [Clostridiales bacterium]